MVKQSLETIFCEISQRAEFFSFISFNWKKRWFLVLGIIYIIIQVCVYLCVGRYVACMYYYLFFVEVQWEGYGICRFKGLKFKLLLCNSTIEILSKYAQSHQRWHHRYKYMQQQYVCSTVVNERINTLCLQAIFLVVVAWYYILVRLGRSKNQCSSSIYVCSHIEFCSYFLQKVIIATFSTLLAFF